MDATSTFLEIVQAGDRSERPDDLVRGAFALAAHDHPIDVEHHLALLDELAAGCADATLESVRHRLFVEAGFQAHPHDYYAPDNSFLDRVLATRQGMPISLSVVLIEVARRVGVDLVGVAMPAHFLVRVRDDPDRFVDPYHGGVERDAAGCAAVFREIAGAKAPFLPEYLRPVSSAAILGRMAANVVNAFRRSDDLAGMRWSARLRARCPGVGAGERISLSQGLARSGAVDEAAQLIEQALPSLGGDEATRWRREAVRLRAQLN